MPPPYPEPRVGAQGSWPKQHSRSIMFIFECCRGKVIIHPLHWLHAWSQAVAGLEFSISSCLLFQEGQRIVCMQDFGLWTEYAAVKSSQCIPIPDSMSFEEAAAIPVNYITAHQMLFDCANLRANMSVLVHMAAGKFNDHPAQSAVPQGCSLSMRPLCTIAQEQGFKKLTFSFKSQSTSQFLWVNLQIRLTLSYKSCSLLLSSMPQIIST